MSVTLDANATANTQATSVTTLDNGNLTVGSGSNRLLLAQLTIRGTALTPASITAAWDPSGANQPLTLVKDVATGVDNLLYSGLYALVAPVSGNKVLRVTWTNTAESVFLNGVSFFNVDQNGGAATFPNTNSASGVGTAPSVTVASSPDHMTVDNVMAATGSAVLGSPTQTQLYSDRVAGSSLGAGSYGAGAASVTFTWTAPSTVGWGSAVCDIAPPALPFVRNIARVFMQAVMGATR